MKISIVHLYPDLMNTYGDRGNILCLVRRCQWRGIEVVVREATTGDRLDPEEMDICFFGGGQDREQSVVCGDLADTKAAPLREAVEDGAVVLAICGGYQLLGKYFRTGTGEVIPGIGLLDAWTVAGARRHIGNVVVRTRFDGVCRTLVGFENHSGKTYLGPGCQPLGEVVVGSGNNGEDGTEGAVYKNVYGCYLHGSLLPKNPWFADHLILLALRRRYGQDIVLEPLDDTLEEQAHRAVVRRAERLGRLATGVR